MNRDEVTIFDSAAQFRAWLEENHDSAKELWLGYYKKGIPKTSITYAEAVDEALCFGWIDGMARRIDDEVTGQRFTPRRRTSNWSAINIAKVAQLKEAGRMHPAGLRAFEERDRRKDAYADRGEGHEMPPEMLDRLRGNPAAWAFWQSRPPSFQRGAAHWVTSAKRPETQERRFRTLLEESTHGRLPAPFLVTREARGKAAE